MPIVTTPRERLLAKLLAETREWLNGCRGALNRDPDEPCECDDCTACTDLLDRVDELLDAEL